MKKNYIIPLLILLGICHLSPIHGEDLKSRQDSLIQLLAKTSNTGPRLELLQELSFLSLDDSTASEWLTQMLKEAKEADLPEKEDWAIRNLTRFYHNMGKLDSVVCYAAKSDSLAKSTGHYTDYYYDAQTFLCQLYLWEGQLEKAADNAIRLYNKAKEKSNQNGIVCSCETLGLINQRIGQDSTAVDFFIEGLDYLRQKPNEQRFMIQFLNNIVESLLKLERFGDARKYLEELDTTINNIKSGVYGPDPSFPYDRCLLLTEAYYINLFVREKNASEAKKHMELALLHLEKSDDAYVRYYYMFCVAGYYKLAGQYAQALNEINAVMKIDPSPEAMKLKGEILYDMGNYQAATVQYREALKQNEEMNTTAFLRQLSLLHATHDMNNLELQVKELRVTELELGAKQQQLKWIMALVALLLVILLVGSKVYLHTRRLKNELQKDKQALLESEDELRIARDRAEEADRLKSLFLSNMSHEIRTPLNAIVGFAQILESETEEDDERKEYTHIITDNSALLLNLVNDILDLSRLESERYRFTFEEQNLSECCRSALTSVEHRVAPGVQLRFSPEDKNFILRTDKFRLQQILINLVGNASKFTQQGFIELAYTIDREAGFVRFTVTDTGCGIPADKQDAIFERFEKLNECAQGTGLGLSICRIIAERFGGEVLLDKEYTEGARFVFTHAFCLS